MNYYRSDTRDPSIIFMQGFEAAYKDAIQNPEKALALALKKYPFAPAQDLTPSADIDEPDYMHRYYVVCMSPKFEVTGMFPIHTTVDSYIYVMSLPDSINLSMKTPCSELPPLYPNQVANIHGLQTQQAHYLAKRYYEARINFDSNEVGWCLHAYEACATKITPDNIIAALKIKRRELPIYEQEQSFAPTGERRNSFARQFKVTGIKFNPNYVTKNPIEYINTRNELLRHFNNGKHNIWYPTPSFSYGLGGTLLPNPGEDISLNDALLSRQVSASA